MVVPLSSPTDRPAKDALKSRITNGSKLLPGVDGRSSWCRRCRDLISEHLADLGGPDAVSAAERSIVRRASTLETELEMLEARFATAGQATADELDLYQRGSSSLRRLFEAIGIQRRSKNITPNLEQYLTLKAQSDGGSDAD